ncbi:hypothetical protein VQ643_12885 [Pseudomonas sp. F1_0610]|uniref:hypothetical protein n=1 Tax=Pseudomonas sp. F1_0610 TaxID=3114284 RepID=UPI0039C3343E
MRKFWIALSLCISLYGGWQLYQLATHPYVSFLIDVTEDELQRNIERSLLVFADQTKVEQKLREALLETPADWLVIDLMQEYAQEQKFSLNTALLEQIELRDSEERGYWAAAQDCWQCVRDPEHCPISFAQTCNVVTEMTPVGDVRSLIIEYGHWQNDQEVDQLNVALSVVGLGATAAAVGTVGSSLSIKVGAGFIKAAKNAKRLNSKLTRFLVRNTAGLLDFSKVPKGWVSEPRLLKQAINSEKYQNITQLAGGVGDMLRGAGFARTIKYVNTIDDAHDAAKLGRLAKVSKSRGIVALEMMGKNRLFKQMSKYSRYAKIMIATAVAFIFSLVGVFFSTFVTLFQHVAVRYIRHKAFTAG